MLTMASSMATVHNSQSLIEVQLVEVCMHLRTIPFTEALHRPVVLLMHVLLAERATLVKEPCEEMQSSLGILSLDERDSVHTLHHRSDLAGGPLQLGDQDLLSKRDASFKR
jgi:hypothetical protein